MNTNHAFISYGRPDSKEFATKLCERLTEKEFNIWFDQHDIPSAVDFQEEINDGIAKADNFIFIIAPHSVNSDYCLKEIKLALKYRKRIIPLLHVEEISKETWQHRNPIGTEEAWLTYRSKGHHSVHPNMHPEISKINWIYFREGADNFGKSLTELINTLQKHESYVQEHTKLLNQALEWESQQKQTRFLLTGEDRITAEKWLNFRFKAEQAPCNPSDLHCEFIIESIKNANNLMTQVFLAYADTDKSVMEKIRQALYREGFTVWTSQTDVKTGESFEHAIFRGIEQADNFVYLLSPDTQNSDYCRKEIEYALNLNKRIIPILVRPTVLEYLDLKLQILQYIDLTNHNIFDDEDWLEKIQLIKILRHDAAYYEKHKVLLAKALKWKRQSSNPSILLRGYDLRSAEAWWKVAQNREQHLPTQIHEQFITASLQQPPINSLDVFISYSRADSDFARKLNDALQLQGKTTWFDQESIATGSDFQQEINRGIESCDNFLFIISPPAVTSQYCAGEVEYAAQLGKRFITVLYRTVESDTLHPELAKVQWISFNQTNQDFNASFNQLVRTLDTDREHVHYHTKWSQRALEWEEKDYSKDLLLRGSEFAIAKEWKQKAQTEKKQPSVTKLQEEFLSQSQIAINAARKREKSLFRLLIALLAGVSVALLGVLHLYQKSAQQTKVADFRANSSEIERLMEIKPVNSLVLAIASLGKSQGQRGIEGELHNLQRNLHLLLDKVRERRQFQIHDQDQKNFVHSVTFSPDGQTIASGHKDGTIRLWDLQGNPIGKPFMGHTDRVYSVAFHPDGKWITSGSRDATLRRWDLQGNPIGPPFIGHTSWVTSVAFSPDGETIVSGSKDKTVRLWSRRGNTIGNPFIGHTDWVRSVAFSSDGQTIVSGSQDGTVRLWDLDGNMRGNPFTGHRNGVVSVAFSPDRKSVVSGGDDLTVRRSDLQGNIIDSPFIGHDDSVLSVTFSPDGQSIVSGSADGKIQLWDRQGRTLDGPMIGHTNWVRSVAVSPDGQTLVSGSDDGTIRVWDISNEPSSNPFSTNGDPVRAVAVSPVASNAKNSLPVVASGGEGGTVALWDLEGNPMGQPLKGHTSWVNALAFSPDGQMIASGSGDKTIRLWDSKGQLVAPPFVSHTSWIETVAFSPDGKTVASGDGDGTIRLWDIQGNPISAPLTDHRDGVTSIMFSPDGKKLVSGSKDRTVRLWTSQGRSIGQPWEGHKEEVTSVAFVSEGKTTTVVSGSKDKTIRRWDLSGNPIGQPFVGHTDTVTSVVFNQDSPMIVSGSGDKTIRLWDMNGNPLGQPLTGHANSIQSIALSPDGQMLVSGSNDTTVRLWSQVTWQAWLQQGCQQLRLHSTLLHPSPDFRQTAKGAVETCLKEQAWSKSATAEFFVQQGRSLARIDGALSEAKKKFKQAQSLDSSVDMEDLVATAKEDAALAKIRQGKDHAINQKRRKAIALYKAALTLDPSADLNPETPELDQDPQTVVSEVVALFHISEGEEFAKQKKIKAAIAAYERAQKFVANLDLNPNTPALDQSPERMAKQVAAMVYIEQGNTLNSRNRR